MECQYSNTATEYIITVSFQAEVALFCLYHLVQTSIEIPTPAIKRILWLFVKKHSAQVVMLTTHIHLQLRLRMCRKCNLLPQNSSWQLQLYIYLYLKEMGH